MIGHEIITASAGAGKTWNLVLRYIRLLALGAAPGTIIALTFSRKAAREFFTAILHRLAEAALTDHAAQRLAQDAGMPALRREDFVRLLAALVREMPALTLGTMDSFFVRIARSFPLELGLAGDFALLDEHQRSLEQERVLQRVFAPGQLNGEGRREFLQAFQQATWGKDEVRLKVLLAQFLKDWLGLFMQAPEADVWGNPEAIWPGGRESPAPGMSFQELIAAARTAMERVPDLKDTQRETLEGFFAILETHTPGTPIHKDGKLTLEKLLELLPQLAAGEAVITLSRTKVTLRTPFTDVLHTLIMRFIHDALTVCLHQTRGIHRILALYDRHYHDMVRRQGRLTFQDVQLILSGDLAAEARGSEALTEKRGLECTSRQSIDYRLDARYAHWLLDEFQDTSRVQWKVLHNLCDEAIQDQAGTRSFFAVGDEKQSIFTWRGAEPGLFGEIQKFYGNAINVRPLALSQRSGPAIISMVNRLCGNLPKLRELDGLRGGVDQWPWQPHTSAHPKLTGCGALIEVPVNKEIEDASEAVWGACADLLRELQPLRRGLTCAVLCHRNSRAADIADLLRDRSGMEVVCESDVSVATDNPAASAMLALLKCAAHPADQFSWQQVLMSPLGDVIAAQWPREEGRTALVRANARRGRFTARVLEQLTAGGFSGTLRTWQKLLLEEVPALDSFSGGRLDDLVRAAREFDAGGSRDVDEFVAFAEAWRIRESAHTGAIQVMTLHKSKGLTFDIVLLPDIHDTHMYQHRNGIGIGRDADREITWLSVLPGKDIASADPVIASALEEAESAQWRERLAQLYVAVTRARRANYILLPPPPAKSESVSLARIVRHMLGDVTPADQMIGERKCAVLSLDGNLEWIGAEKLKAPAVAATAAQEDLFGGRWDAAGSRETAIPLAHARPSAAKPTRAAGLTNLAARREARHFGTLVHTLFSRVEWGGDEAAREFFTRTMPSPENWQARALDTVRRCLRDPGISRVFAKPAGETALWRERPFEAVIEGECVSGVFDRVTVTSGAAHLIEFKTDQLRDEPDAIKSAVGRHSHQTQLYRAALQQLTGLPAAKINVSLLFTALPRIVALDD